MSIPSSFIIEPSTLGHGGSVNSGAETKKTLEKVLISVTGENDCSLQPEHDSWVAPSLCSANNSSMASGASGLVVHCPERAGIYAIVTPSFSKSGGPLISAGDPSSSIYPTTFTLTVVKDDLRINEIPCRFAPRVKDNGEPSCPDPQSGEGEQQERHHPVDVKWAKWLGNGMSILWSDGVSIQCEDVFTAPSSSVEEGDDGEEEEEESQDEVGVEEGRGSSIITLSNEGIVPLKVTNKSVEEGEGKLAALVVSAKTGCSLILRDRNPEAPNLSPPVSSHDGGGGADPNFDRKKKKQAQASKYTWFLSVPPNKAFEGITTVAVCPQQQEEEKRLATNQNGVIASFLCFSHSACTLGGLRQDVQSYFLIQRKTLMFGESLIPRCALVPTSSNNNNDFPSNGALTAVLIYYSKDASQQTLGFDDDEMTPALNAVASSIGPGGDRQSSLAGTSVSKIEAHLKNAALASGEATTNLKCGLLRIGVNTMLSFEPLELFTKNPQSGDILKEGKQSLQDRLVKSATRLHSFDPENESLWIEVSESENKNSDGRILKCVFDPDEGLILKSQGRLRASVDRDVHLLGMLNTDTCSSLIIEAEGVTPKKPVPQSQLAGQQSPTTPYPLGLMADEGRAGKWGGSTFFSSREPTVGGRLFVSTDIAVRSMELEPLVTSKQKGLEKENSTPSVHQDPIPPGPAPLVAQSAPTSTVGATGTGSQATIEQVQQMLEHQKAQLLEQLKNNSSTQGHEGGAGITFAQQEEKLRWYREEMSDLKKQLEKSERSRQLYKQRCEKKEKELLKTVAQVKPLKTKVAELESVIDRLGVTYPLPKQLTESATLRLTALIPKHPSDAMKKPAAEGKKKVKAQEGREEPTESSLTKERLQQQAKESSSPAVGSRQKPSPRGEKSPTKNRHEQA